jgi:hypothetical protein
MLNLAELAGTSIAEIEREERSLWRRGTDIEIEMAELDR